MFVIFETNGDEASGFLSNYFDIKAIALLILGVLYIFFSAKWLWRNQLNAQLEKAQKGFMRFMPVVVMSAIVFGCLYGIHWKFKEENIPFTIVSSFSEYKQTKELLKDQLAKPKGQSLHVKSNLSSQATYVIVIGESTTRRNLQLYGYDRETNPLLSEIKEELIIFDSVISPHVHTITAMDKIMTLQSFERPKVDPNVSIVQLANQAGYKTFWLSNQRAVGVFESIPTIIGSAADERYFLNGNAYNDVAYDEILLPKYEEILADTTAHKMIFVHLMGTHVGYDKRYPKDYNHFKGQRKNKDEKASEYINQYDNAVRYNDWILKQLIEALRKKSGDRYLLYLSDHGDDVFEEQNGIGHNEYNATRPMFEVPFILWSLNDQIHLFSDALNIENRRYSLEDFVHSFADLAALKFDGYDSTKSLFNVEFVPKKRIIKDTIDYDNW